MGAAGTKMVSLNSDLQNEFARKAAGVGLLTGTELPGAAPAAGPRVEAAFRPDIQVRPEAIIIASEFARPALVVRNNTFEEPLAESWRQILNPNRTRLEKAIRSVGRVELRNHATFPWVGTAWMISEDVAVTNRHVAMEFAAKQGGGFAMLPGIGGAKITARVDFREEHGVAIAREVAVEEVLFIADPGPQNPDVAFLKVDKKAGLPEPIELVEKQPDNAQKVVTIGYPANDPRNPAPAVNRVFGDIFEVKRFAPGEVTGDLGGFLFTHDCSTLGGNSGSVVVEIESGKAVGLHFGGSFRQANFAVTAAELKRLLKSQKIQVAVPSSFAPKPVELEVETPPMKAYADARGYEAEFLGRPYAVPLPALKPEIAGSAAPVKGSEDPVLRYTHFSIVMNKDRRFAIYTAVNIDGAQSIGVRRRRDKWYFDPRVAQEHQAGPELYFDNDLDRGHLVRRLDPVWGERAVAKKANDQTFHFTNCTPQHAQFNQKTWNELEDYILDNADVLDLKVSVFTGPVFSDEDPVYRGIQLPEQYWKVVAMVSSGASPRLSVTAYVLSQRDLLTNLEFVFGQFRTYQVPVSRVEELTYLDFGKMKNFDPLNTQESFAIRELRSVEEIRL